MRALVFALLGCGCQQLLGLDAPRLDDAGMVEVDAEVDAPVAVDAAVPLVAHLGEPLSSFSPSMALTITASTVIDTTTGAFGSFPAYVAAQGNGQSVMVLPVASVEIAAGATLRVTGSRPLIVVSAGPVEIAGRIDASSTSTTIGPGGFAPAGGPSAGSDGTHVDVYLDSGGGGGGGGTAGGGAGPSPYTQAAVSCGSTPLGTIAAATAGGAASTDLDLAVLQGGSGGGWGGATASTSRAAGGPGGGALQISTPATISVTQTGELAAHGGGGSGATGSNTNSAAGGGGGAGGAIYLQAPTVSIAGIVAANGGGGGGGASLGMVGGAGGDGASSLTPALGGAFLSPYGGAGGAGGTGGAAPETSGAAPQCGNSGGGGGAVGRIVVDGAAFSATQGSLVSPAPRRLGGM